MIELVAIDDDSALIAHGRPAGVTAEVELLRLAADFAKARLLKPALANRLHLVVEVSAIMPPRPIARAQLATKSGLFRSAKSHFDCTISLAQSFEMAVLQMMHEMVHVTQILTNRYQITGKMKKIAGEKQLVYQARWLGKKAGVIDETPWQERPWEQEAASAGERLTTEFMAMLYGTQSVFEASSGKKQLQLLPFTFSLPPMPEAAQPEVGMPEVEMPEVPSGEPTFEAPTFEAPTFEAPTFEAPVFDAPHIGDGEEGGLPSDDQLFADIDALLAQDDAESQAETTGADAAADAPLDEVAVKQMHIAGIAEPRPLKIEALDAKLRELAARGLVQKPAK